MEQVAVHVDEAKHAEASRLHRVYMPKLGVMPFLWKRMLGTGWEKLQMILDGGASVSVVPPSVGREYELVRGEAALAGVRYEVADSRRQRDCELRREADAGRDPRGFLEGLTGRSLERGLKGEALKGSLKVKALKGA